jgi:hypothetical protein
MRTKIISFWDIFMVSHSNIHPQFTTIAILVLTIAFRVSAARVFHFVYHG